MHFKFTSYLYNIIIYMTSIAIKQLDKYIVYDINKQIILYSR